MSIYIFVNELAHEIKIGQLGISLLCNEHKWPGAVEALLGVLISRRPTDPQAERFGRRDIYIYMYICIRKQVIF